jgi:hypothetical protein
MDMENLEGESWGMSRPSGSSATARDAIQRLVAAPPVPQSRYVLNWGLAEESVSRWWSDDRAKRNGYIALQCRSSSGATS